MNRKPLSTFSFTKELFDKSLEYKDRLYRYKVEKILHKKFGIYLGKKIINFSSIEDPDSTELRYQQCQILMNIPMNVRSYSKTNPMQYLCSQLGF